MDYRSEPPPLNKLVTNLPVSLGSRGVDTGKIRGVGRGEARNLYEAGADSGPGMDRGEARGARDSGGGL